MNLSTPKKYFVAELSLDWQQAMNNEINALHTQKTWILVPSPS